jgi:hypothetical protein
MPTPSLQNKKWAEARPIVLSSYRCVEDKIPTQGRAYLYTSPFAMGKESPRREEQFESYEYYHLRRDATFTNLQAVPSLVGATSDCSECAGLNEILEKKWQ